MATTEQIVEQIVNEVRAENRHIAAAERAGALQKAVEKIVALALLMSMEEPKMLVQDADGITPLERFIVRRSMEVSLAILWPDVETAYRRGQSEATEALRLG